MTSSEAYEILRDDENCKHWSELGFKSIDEFNNAYNEAYEMALQALLKCDN